MSSQLFIGIDLGSSYTKGVVLDEQATKLAEHTVKTGINFDQAAENVWQELLTKLKLTAKAVTTTVSTGVGRNNCAFKHFSKPEINCLSKGVFHFHQKACTIIDIGGQDNKIIKLDQSGKQLSFKMNRKCAAGTGSFLEEISYKMGISIAEMNTLAQESTCAETISSFCTVFAATEIIHHMRAGANISAILRGVFDSVTRRVLEMDTIENDLVATGGAVFHNPMLLVSLNELLRRPVHLLPSPQTMGAFGAALYALESHSAQ
ncbi:MAG: acyl-CoA dehydratase activase [Bdellovibrionota bacterium]